MNKGSHSNNTTEDSDDFKNEPALRSSGTKKPDTIRGSHSYNTVENSDVFESQITQQSTSTKKPDTARGTSTYQMNINKRNKISGNVRITQKGPKFIKTSQPIDVKANINEDNIVKGKAVVNQEAPSICAPASSKFEINRNIGNEVEGDLKLSQAAGDIQEPTQTIDVKHMHFKDNFVGDVSDCRVKTLEKTEFDKRVVDDKNYDVTNYGKSRALIINITTNREGAEKDTTNLQRLLPQLGFSEPQVAHNKNTEAIKRIIADFTKPCQENRDAPMMLVFIGSHGKRVNNVDHFYDSEGKLVSAKEDIVEPFHAEKCLYLARKPKLFLFQFCRHVPKADSSEPMEVDGEEEASYLKWFKSDFVADNIKADHGHNKANMLLSYATSPGCLAYRSPKNGSWYVTALYKVFAKNAHKDDIQQMLTKVNKVVSDRRGSDDSEVQMSVFESYLVKDLLFLPH